MADKAISKTKSIMKRDFVYGVKGSEGWLKIPIGGSDKATRYQVKDLSQAEQESMRLEMYDLLVPFINYKERSLVATYVGLDQVDGVSVNHVELQGQGVKYNLYFDAKTGLLKREKQTQAGIVTTTDYDNYKKSKYGLMYPSTLTEMSSKDNAKNYHYLRNGGERNHRPGNFPAVIFRTETIRVGGRKSNHVDYFLRPPAIL